MEIAGRVALVTGAGVGTGRAIALALAAAGAEVVASDVDVDGGERTAAECGGRFVRADLLDPAKIRALIDDARPQILVNNAGGGGHIPPHFPDAPPERWGALLDLNLRAPMLATQLALAAMRGDGAIVHVASSAGAGAEPYASPEYAAAKAGLIRFTSALAAVEGVRVNCVVPDWVATERLTARERAATPPPIPLERVAAAVLDLVRDDAAAGRAVELWRGQDAELGATDLAHLRRCVALAEASLEAGDEPFGSVLVDGSGAIRFEDRNRVAGGDHTRHPELAIARWAAEHLTPEERAAATVYTSGEHCPMCAAAHGWVGLGRIVYASSTEQLSRWLAELGVPAGPVRPLPIRAVVPGAVVQGPVPQLAAAVRALQERFHARGG
jgi:NAD(P)-dependent dehydrogenase (short-subunit alcohol dehydrogenase family)/tRNA(Arg) A34 adenosine deaminase TadA